MSTLAHDIPYLSFQLRDDLERYLVHSRKLLNETDWYYNGRRLEVDALHIDQNVITEQIQQQRSLIGNEEQESKPEIKQHPLEITNQAHLYELTERFSERVRTRWSVALGKRDLKLAIIGAPGSGKSFTTTNEVIRRIDEALYQSQYRVCPLDDIQIPIWVTATELASQDTNEPAEALEKIIRAATEELRLSEKFFRFLRRKLDLVFDEASDKSASLTKHIFLVVDSLDEVPHARLPSFNEISAHLDKHGLQLLMTCRTLDWDDRHSFLGFTPRETVEIAPLTSSQQGRFADNFFHGDEERRPTMRDLFDGNPALQHAFSTPLLLTFGCLLHGDDALRANTGYVKIYGLVIAGIFKGRWRHTKPYWHDDDVKTAEHLGLLDKVCWLIFQANPAINMFTRGDWEKACVNVSSTASERAVNPGDFLRELTKLGLVQRAGFNDRAQPQWSFTHRTFLEFLAARAVSERDDWLEIARQHFWFDPEWLECLTFLAGLLGVEDAKKLIDAVRAEKNDIFGSMTLLDAKLTGASALTFPHMEPICKVLIYDLSPYFGQDYLQIDKPSGTAHLAGMFVNRAHSFLALNKSYRSYLEERLIIPITSRLQDEAADKSEKWGIVHYLKERNIRSQTIIAALIYCLANDPDPSIKYYAAQALGDFCDDPSVVEALVACFRTDPDVTVCRSALFRFEDIADQDERYTNLLIEALIAEEVHHPELEELVAKTLKNLTRRPEMVADLVESLVVDDVESVRVFASKVFGGGYEDLRLLLEAILTEIIVGGSPTTNLYLFNLLQELARQRKLVGPVSVLLARALVILVRDENNHLSTITHYEKYIREEAITTLGIIGDDSQQVIDVLFEGLRPVEGVVDDGHVIRLSELLYPSDKSDLFSLFSCFDLTHRSRRNKSIDALGELANHSHNIRARLVDSLGLGNPYWIRFSAAEALGELRTPDPKVTRALIACLSPDDDARYFAAIALGKISRKTGLSLVEPIVVWIASIIIHGRLWISERNSLVLSLWRNRVRANNSGPALTSEILESTRETGAVGLFGHLKRRFIENRRKRRGPPSMDLDLEQFALASAQFFRDK